MDAGDLHWRRVQAGEYETEWWANGYKYRIEKDDYYPNTWHMYYKWHGAKKRDWKPVRAGYSGSSTDTLKDAKVRCTRHNLRPRRKFKFVGRTTIEQVGNPRERYNYQSKYLGYLEFVEVDKDGKKLQYGTKHYLNPKQIGGEDREVINNELQLLGQQERNQDVVKTMAAIVEAEEKRIAGE